MGRVFARIRAAIEADRMAVSVHTMIRLRQRQILLRQVATGSVDGRRLSEDPHAHPNPKVEVKIIIRRSA